MDEIVKAALAKWPNVPHCHGWLGLDTRGDWYLRDDAVQAAGPFPQVKGSRIDNERLCSFIARNYQSDAAGCWYFQNGPQRVLVDLEAAPWVWRLEGGAAKVTLHAHTGAAASMRAAWLDRSGRLFIDTDLGFGLVHTQDTGIAAQAIDGGLWALAGELPFAEMPARFGYVLRPRAG